MSATSFEQLKREAVNLERQLEDKIGRYQQVRKANFAASRNGGQHTAMLLHLETTDGTLCLTIIMLLIPSQIYPYSWRKN